jgi:glucose/arabinose dehydrogenase
VVGAALTVSLMAAPPPLEPLGRPSTKLYQEFCAACHGENLAGGKGPSLLTSESKHGRDEATLRRIILEGVTGTEMPGFSAALSDAETQGLITYLRERATEAADPKLWESNQLPTEIQTSALHRYRFESIAEGLDVPWSFVFLPDGRILVTEREGRLRVIENEELLPDSIAGVPDVVPHDEGGLMALALDPNYTENGWIYFSFSDPGEEPALKSPTAMTKVMRARLQENRLVDHETIFSIPREQYQKGFVGYGCRLLFIGEHLYFTVGDRWVPADAQDLTKPNGKVHRIFPDGKIPSDNPFANQAGAFGSIWSFGHRNPQGLAVDPRNGAIWATEHGPRGGDELNLIRRGANYGWPLVTFGMNYDGTPISTRTEQAGLESPVINWTPSIAASPLLVYTGDKFPHWKNNLFLGSLGQQKFIRYEINERNEIVQEEELFKGLGRVRDIKTGPDGHLYLSLELVGTPGRIVRLVPAPAP